MVGEAAMFCSNCGKEVPNEARFCLHCGTNLAALQLPLETVGAVLQLPSEPSPAAFLPPTFKTVLRDYHVFEWQGTCPACQLVHNSANCSCPNDGSPVVVAFKDTRKPKAMLYPLYAAEMRCLNDCGVAVNAFPCSRCGAVIKGKYITFRFPESLVKAHKHIHAIMRTARIISILWLAFFACYTYWVFESGASKPYQEMWGPGLVVSAVAFYYCKYSKVRVRYYWRKEIFDFNDVADYAEAYAKFLAIRDSIRSAKAVQDATRPWTFGSGT